MNTADVSQNEAAAVPEDFAEIFYNSVEAGFKQILGESGSRATLYHLRFRKGKTTPVEFHEELVTMFHAGAEAIEKVVVTELYKSLESESEIRSGYSFAKHVQLANKIHSAKLR
jgi:hypothetical protein